MKGLLSAMVCGDSSKGFSVIKPPIDFDSAFVTHRRAKAGDIDVLGHVNNAVYVSWVQDAAVQHWQAMASDMLQNRVLFVVLRHELDYRDPVEEGDAVEARTWLGAWSGPRFDRHVDIRKAGALRFSARAKTTWCMLDRQTRRPKRVDDEVLRVFGLR